MKPVLFVNAARAFALAMALGAAAPSFAIPVMDMRIEDLLPMAPDVKQSLKLTPNQSTLWNQVEAKSHAIVRARVARREHLQSRIKQAVDGAKVELRDLAGALDAETAASAAEETQLRELWLSVNDALDEHQRQMVAVLVSEQLLRVADAPGPRGPTRPKDEGGQHRGMGRNKGGAQGGQGAPGL